MVILGGGFVAIGVVRAARRAIRRGDLDVTVVDRENYHFYHGLVSEFVLGRVAPTNVLSPCRRIFPGARFALAETDSVDLAGRKISIRRHLDGVQQEMPYDHLILGLGSADNLEMYPGLAEHAFKLKTYDDCFRLKNHILMMFELAELEKDPDERRRLLTFFIAGGGYAGTEMAGGLADLATRLCNREFSALSRDECRVVLVQPGPTILPELYGRAGRPDEGGHPKLVRYATNFVANLGVEVMTNTKVTAASSNEVSLSNGERIPTRTIISAVGTKQTPIIESLDVPKDERGRVLTDKFCRVEGRDNLWAGGDCSAVPDPEGDTSPPQALSALQHGKRISRNIQLQSQGLPHRPYSYRRLGQGVPLGGHAAVAEMKGIEITGPLAWLMMRGFLLYYTPSWDRRLRLAADWLITGVVGRDIVESSIADADDYEIEHHLFQPGEVIVSEGRVGRHVHVIIEGQVELLRQAGGKAEVTATLKAGDRFGQAWRDQTSPEQARAKTLVKTVTLRTDQTRRIQKLLSTLGSMAGGSAKTN